MSPSFNASSARVSVLLLFASLSVPAAGQPSDEYYRQWQQIMRSNQAAQQQLLQMQQQILNSAGGNFGQLAPPGAGPARASDSAEADVVDFQESAPGASVPPMPGIAGRAAIGAASAAPGTSPAPSAAAPPKPPMIQALESEAAAETHKLLNSPDKLDAFIKQNGGAAAAADAVVDRLTSDPRVKQAIYGLSSDVFNELVKRTNGDPSRMLQEIEKAKADPKDFADSWSPETREKLRRLSGQVEAPPKDPQ